MTLKKLGELKKGEKGRITEVRNTTSEKTTEDFASRLLSFGVTEGAEIEVVHEAPFGADPIAVKIRGTLVGLRRAEANCVTVEV